MEKKETVWRPGAVRAATKIWFTFKAALSPLLGKGLAATGTPLRNVSNLEPLYIGQQLAEGDSAGEIATNPINYLGAAFAGPLSKEATRFASTRSFKYYEIRYKSNNA